MFVCLSAGSRNLWVSSLSTTTRATDLKALFSKYGKVGHSTEKWFYELKKWFLLFKTLQIILKVAMETHRAFYIHSIWICIQESNKKTFEITMKLEAN